VVEEGRGDGWRGGGAVVPGHGGQGEGRAGGELLQVGLDLLQRRRLLGQVDREGNRGVATFEMSEGPLRRARGEATVISSVLMLAWQAG
jgi:hypothetical protein